MMRMSEDMPPAPDRRVVNAATLWREHRNSWDIARALHVTEPQALRLLDQARKAGLLP